jgi:xanthine dehydrogenase accessory factor
VIEALARLGAAMDLAVEVVSDADDPSLTPRPEGRSVVIATMGENDEGALRRALALEPDYIGVVASRRRYAGVREFLLSRGADRAALDRVSNPAGLEIGARKPAEIALAILAEIVRSAAARRDAVREHAEAVGGPAGEPGSAGAETAVDPVCGMTVVVASAEHRADHAGRTYWFCCGGCRERFVAEPGVYLR